MDRGYIKLWRKSLEKGWLQNPKLWTFWSWCLLKASHRERKVVIGNQEITLKPGQFICGRNQAAIELHMNPSLIYRLSMRLKNERNLDIKSNNKFSVYSIINWTIYQGQEDESEQLSEQLSEQQMNTYNNGKNVKKNNNPPTPLEISNQISGLRERYSDQGIIDQAFQAIAATRKSHRIADSVKLSILHAWERYPVESVIAGIRTYLQKEYQSQGKGEKYLLGIIRNFREASTTGGQVMKSTGSPLLDAYYRSGGSGWSYDGYDGA